MSTPLATPDELGVYLTGTAFAPDDARSLLMLQLAHDRLEMYASPVPVLGKGIELAVAARAYNNVNSAHQAGIGSAQVSYGAPNSSVGIGGLYVSKSEIRDLRKLAGRTGAFSIDLIPVIPPTDVPNVWSIDPEGAVAADLVRMVGAGFTDATAVTVDGTAAEFLVVDDTLIHLVIPAGSAGDVPVVVTNAIGASDPFTYTRG